MKIFISIASYQDPLLLETICSAYMNASNKQNLRFGVCEQADEGIDVAGLIFSDQIDYELIQPVMARGPCWARERIQNFYQDEDFFLQIDSHMIFSEGWDEILISYHDWITGCGIDKFVITGYPRSFKPNEDLTNFELDTRFKETLGITFREDRLFEDGYFSMQKSFPANSNNPVVGLLVAAGFIFSSGSLLKEIPYDPKLYFHGEELSIALRLFTNNWSVVHIPRVPLFHLYTDIANLPRKLHWNDEDEKNRVVKWKALDEASKKRLGELIHGDIKGIYGLGNKKSLQGFIDLCGLDLIAKTVISQDIATKNFPFRRLEREDLPFNSIVFKNN